MTVRDDFDRLMTVWLDETAGAGAPDYLDETLDGIAKIEQRPAWLSPGRWLPMQLTMPRVVVPRALPLLAVIALLIAALVIAALIVGSQRRLPPPFGLAATGSFVFDKAGDLYLATTAGDVDRVLTRGDNADFGATFSRDGTHVAYWSMERDGPAALRVMEADGANPRSVATGLDGTPDTVNPAADWSPDGHTLVFTIGGKLYVVDADGTDLRQIGGGSVASPTTPAWSPDGRHVAFADEDPSGQSGVYVVDRDGQGLQRISQAPGRGFLTHRFPAWSPDGSALIYHTGADRGDIAVASLDGATWTETLVVDGPTSDVWPEWSNDGRRISFIRSAPTDHGYIVVADPDGANERQLDSRLIGWAPHCWTPDDRSIVAVTAVQDLGIGDEPEPGFVVVSVDDGGAPVFIPTPERLAFGACSLQRLAR